MSPSDHESEQGEQTGPVIRDNRRIDPVTYQVREPRGTAAPAAEEADTITTTNPADNPADAQAVALAELQTQLGERTADLQRLQAEYVNYKRRVDRDRDLVRTGAVEQLLKEFLPVLDNVRSAREHGELTGAFKAVGEDVERITAKHGLVAYGEAGDPFDPHIHEALMHSHADGITGPTCVQILQPGFKVGERVLRPAMVAVAEPDPSVPAASESAGVPEDSTEPSEPAADQQRP